MNWAGVPAPVNSAQKAAGKSAGFGVLCTFLTFKTPFRTQSNRKGFCFLGRGSLIPWGLSKQPNGWDDGLHFRLQLIFTVRTGNGAGRAGQPLRGKCYIKQAVGTQQGPKWMWTLSFCCQVPLPYCFSCQCFLDPGEKYGKIHHSSQARFLKYRMLFVCH